MAIKNNKQVRKTRTTAKSVDKTIDKSKKKTYSYVIESGIALSGVRSTGLVNSLPFDAMKVGDSFLIPAGDPLNKKINALHYAAKQYAKSRPGFTVTTRLQLNKERRVWRLK